MTSKIGYQKLKEIEPVSENVRKNLPIYQYAVTKFSKLPFEEQWKQIEKAKGTLDERK